MVIFVLQSLPSSYSQFIINYTMNAKDVTLPELHNLLKTYDQTLPKKEKSIMFVGQPSNPNPRNKGAKGKGKSGAKANTSSDRPKRLNQKRKFKRSGTVHTDECLFCK